MLNSNYSLRSKYGSGYCTVFDDDIIIHWTPLSIGDFIKYELLFKSNSLPIAIIEDEIFKKCVKDKEYIKDINFLPAGLISTVAQNIYDYSGPATIQEFNDFLDYNREQSDIPFHQMVTWIVRAFPSYKLEDIYSLEYETFMLRLAQAESLLMRLGIIKEPIYMQQPEEKPKAKPSKVGPEDMKRIKEHWENERKNFDNERIFAESAAGSQENNDERARMVKEAALVYKDTINKLPAYAKPKKEG